MTEIGELLGTYCAVGIGGEKQLEKGGWWGGAFKEHQEGRWLIGGNRDREGPFWAKKLARRRGSKGKGLQRGGGKAATVVELTVKKRA